MLPAGPSLSNDEHNFFGFSHVVIFYFEVLNKVASKYSNLLQPASLDNTDGVCLEPF
jgi:hypothetical protein